METRSGSNLLKLVSSKILSPSAVLGTQNRILQGPKQLPVKKTWLLRTVQNNGTVKPFFQPLLRALADLQNSDAKLKQFTTVLSEKDVESAKSIWQDILKLSSTTTTDHTSTDHTSDPSTTDKSVNDKIFRKWETLTAKFGNHGPQSFANALNKATRVHNDFPGLASNVTLQAFEAKSPLAPYVFGTILEKLVQKDTDQAIALFNSVESLQPDQTVSQIGIDAMLYGVKMEPAKVVQIFKDTNARNILDPSLYRLPSKYVALIYRHAPSFHCADAVELLAPYIDLVPSYDRLLRRIYTTSDKGAKTVKNIAVSYELPISIYPFVVKRLCERISNSKEKDDFRREAYISQLNKLFDGPLLRLAEESPQILLYLLIIRTITLEGVAATAPILNKWQESDESGVSPEAWMLLFTNFRRSGYPDKCSEVLSRRLKENSLVDMHVVSEYLHFTAHYYHLHAHLAAFLKIVPEAAPTLDFLGISEYAHHIPGPIEPPLCELKPELTTENRGFPTNLIHESWLVATYNAVLATIESVEDAMTLFDRYMAYMHYSKTPTSMKVTDQFVKLLAIRIGEPAALDAAEHIFHRALAELDLATATDGRNHAKSLEVLCYQLTSAGHTDRAIKLLMTVAEHPRAVIKGSALQPMLKHLSPEVGKRIEEWAERVGAKIETQIESPQTVKAP